VRIGQLAPTIAVLIADCLPLRGSIADWDCGFGSDAHSTILIADCSRFAR